MRRPAPAALLLSLVLVTGCSGSSHARPQAGADPSLAPSPVATLPARVAALPESDHYVVQARTELTRSKLNSALAALAKLRGVNGASLVKTTIRVDVSAAITTEQRTAVLRALAAIGTVSVA